MTDLIKQAEEEKTNFDEQILMVNAKIEKEKAMKDFMRQKEADLSEMEKLYRQTEEEEKLALTK